MTGWKQQIHQVSTYPSSIRGLPNGQFPADALKPIADRNGREIGRLNPEAARAWRAMVGAAANQGVSLTVVSAYRDLRTQQQFFTDRYRQTDQGNGSRKCGGRTWYLRKGQATAACPGTSNHGLGDAVDVSISGPVLAWLESHAAQYGWAWEIASEDWHIHYMSGDRLPDPVLAYEQAHGATGDDDMTPDQAAQLKGVAEAVVETRDNVRKIVEKVAALEAKVATLSSKS